MADSSGIRRAIKIESFVFTNIISTRGDLNPKFIHIFLILEFTNMSNAPAIKMPPASQNINWYADKKGTPAITTPMLINIRFVDMHFLFFQYIIRVGINSSTAIDQK